MVKLKYLGLSPLIEGAFEKTNIKMAQETNKFITKKGTNKC